MTFGNNWGWGADRETSRAVFDAFVEAGGNFIDTAYVYTDGESERLVGEFVAADRDHFVIGTKYSSSLDHDIGKAGNSRKNMMRSVEASLRRLATDHIDVFWLHTWDGATPIEEIMRGLDDLVRAGKILYVGFSNTPAWQVARAGMLADLRGWAPVVAIQIEYSLAERTAERDLLPMARELDLGVLAWSPLAGGRHGTRGLPRHRCRDRPGPGFPPRSAGLGDHRRLHPGRPGLRPRQPPRPPALSSRARGGPPAPRSPRRRSTCPRTGAG
jgi:aryl-alcohol dehydrogenase-like predicted oxidoreductase